MKRGWALDLGAIWALMAVRGWAWPRNQPSSLLPEVPAAWWRLGSAPDFLLDGPDAGAWASAARDLMAGQPPDLHRLPVYPRLIALVFSVFPDIPFSGHLVNHALGALLAPLIYLWGRDSAGRAAGLLAGGLVALSPELVQSQGLFGVDPAFAVAVALVGWAGWWTARGPWGAAALGGIAAGILLSTHFLGLLAAPTVLLMALMGGDRRGARLGLALGAGAATVLLLRQGWPSMSISEVVNLYREGVAGSDGRTERAAGGALALLQWDGAPALAVQRALKPIFVEGLPWWLLLALAALGLRPPRGDWRSTAQLLVLLGPLVALEAARAPDRYAWPLRGVTFLLVGRGFSTALSPLSPGLRLAAAAAALALVQAPLRAAWPASMPVEDSLHERAVGMLIAREFPGGGGVVTVEQGIAFGAGRERCPGNPCPTEGEGAVEQCLALIRSQCRGSPVPYVVDIKARTGFADQRNALMDAWALENGEVVGRIEGRDRTTTVLRLP